MNFKNFFKTSMEHVKTGFDTVRTAVEKAAETAQQTVTGISIVDVDVNILNVHDSAVCTKDFKVRDIEFNRGFYYEVYSFDGRFYIVKDGETLRLTEQAFKTHFVIFIKSHTNDEIDTEIDEDDDEFDPASILDELGFEESIERAREAGVPEEQIVHNLDEINAYFNGGETNE